MKTKATIGFGIFLILTGLSIWLSSDPGVYNHPIPNEIGIVFILIGLIHIIYGTIVYRRIARDESNPEYAAYVICVKCQSSYSKKAVDGSNCPKCGGQLENLSGFFERHPELKEK